MRAYDFKHLFVNYECKRFNILYVASLGDGDSTCLNHDPVAINGAIPRGQKLREIYTKM